MSWWSGRSGTQRGTIIRLSICLQSTPGQPGQSLSWDYAGAASPSIPAESGRTSRQARQDNYTEVERLVRSRCDSWMR